jgi:hypothetical protein
MKISLVLEDIGAGPQVVFSTPNPAEALEDYKTRKTVGKLALVINPAVELHRKGERAQVLTAAPKRKAATLI